MNPPSPAMRSSDARTLEHIMMADLVTRRVGNNGRAASGAKQKLTLLAIAWFGDDAVDLTSLAQVCCVQRSTMSTIVSALVGAGLVSRKRARGIRGQMGGFPHLYAIHTNEMAKLRVRVDPPAWRGLKTTGVIKAQRRHLAWARAIRIRETVLADAGKQLEWLLSRSLSDRAARARVREDILIAVRSDQLAGGVLGIEYLGELVGIVSRSMVSVAIQRACDRYREEGRKVPAFAQGHGSHAAGQASERRLVDVRRQALDGLLLRAMFEARATERDLDTRLWKDGVKQRRDKVIAFMASPPAGEEPATPEAIADAIGADVKSVKASLARTRAAMADARRSA